ncbi:MAG TPA: class I SAM-dependent methyltransferase [Terriglobales bacterium]|jgi:SAM-dependent methyltransferase|nr:class I SAM-dependent methyltransferase [Terriglobales bacterium]
MGHRVCPWWLGYFLISPLRRLQVNPGRLLSPFIREGMTVLEPGPGMGFFTIPLARLVGSKGRVAAVDVQPKMIRKLKRRVAKAGLEPRVDARLVAADSMGISDLRGAVDFILAFAVVHEMSSPRSFFAEAAAACKSGARLLLVEPAGHVRNEEFEAELRDAAQAGFELLERPHIRRTQAALLQRADRFAIKRPASGTSPRWIKADEHE